MRSAPASVGNLLRYDVDDPAWSWPVYRQGNGPPVIVIHELLGLTPPIRAFADRLAAHFRVYLPVLFGPVPADSPLAKGIAATRCCISREVDIFRTGRTSRVVTPLRALAVHLARDRQPVGVIGMCMSGGFALALAAQAPVAGSVAAQPSLPFATPVTPWCRRDIGLGPTDVGRLAARLGTGETEVRVVRFTADARSPHARVEALLERVGTTGVGVDEIPSGPGTDFAASAHSVLSAAPTKYPTGPAAERLDQAAQDVIGFLSRRLG